MKKSILSLILVLFSTLLFSQSSVFISIDGSKYDLLNMRSSFAYNIKTHTIITTSAQSIITLSLVTDNYNVGDVYYIKRFSYLPGNGIETVATKTITKINDTVSFRANIDSNRTLYNVYFPFDSWNTSPAVFEIAHQNPIFNINTNIDQFNNTIQFNIDTLLLNYTNSYWGITIKGLYEYAFTNSTVTPIANTTTIAATKTVSYVSTNTIPYTSSGVYYLHLKSYGATITQWTTYSVNLSYIPQTVSIVENEKLISNLNVYPNPAQDVINISFNTNQPYEIVKISSITGQLISSSKMETNLHNEIAINIQHYTPGVYIAQIGANSYKFIKQ